MAATFDPTLLDRVPPEVLEAERTLSRWFAEQNIRDWQLGDCQARIVPTCPKCGTHEVSLQRSCHNSACDDYANDVTVYEGWR